MPFGRYGIGLSEEQVTAVWRQEKVVVVVVVAIFMEVFDR